MSLLLNNADLDPSTDKGQRRLASAYLKHTRPLCGCTSPHPVMYIAYVNDRYVVKRMPSSGAKHSPHCASFLPPEELSGLAQVQGTAIEEHPEENTTLLRLDFALRKNARSPTPPAPSGREATEVKPPPRKLTLTSLLHYLWQESDLIKWTPAMAGKRSWGVVHRVLLEAASNKIAKNMPLSSRLFVPEPFSLDEKNQIAARRKIFFHNLTANSGTGTALGVLVAEYKSHEQTRLGAKFTFKHLPDCAFFADAGFLKRFENVFSARVALADMVHGTHVMCVATFSISKGGYPVLHEMGMMLTTANWIPFEHLRDAEVIDAMTDQKRAFLKSMRFNLDGDVAIASMVATDLSEPVAMFTSGPADSSETLAALASAANEGTYPSWTWLCDDAPFPDLPTNQSLSNKDKTL